MPSRRYPARPHPPPPTPDSSECSGPPLRMLTQLPQMPRSPPTGRYPANEPKLLLAQLSAIVMNAVEINNQYMANQQGGSATAINQELLSIFETLQADMISDR